uniref:Uncharacterized protein n=1 Tax=Cacopsylla melanoneura TaxID=428564 RepID=A0A8D8YPJ0_9HEMI
MEAQIGIYFISYSPDKSLKRKEERRKKQTDNSIIMLIKLTYILDLQAGFREMDSKQFLNIIKDHVEKKAFYGIDEFINKNMLVGRLGRYIVGFNQFNVV